MKITDYTIQVRILSYLISLVVMALLIISCEFEPTGAYELKTNKETTDPKIDVISLDLTKDTLVQSYDRGYSFKLMSNKQIYYTRIWLDQKQVFSQPVGNGVFYIKIEDFSEGYHTLKMEVNTETGTNSIADQLGAETFQIYSQMTIYIRRKFTGEGTTAIKNNHLVVSWDDYEAPDLIHFEVRKSICGKEYTFANVVDNQLIDSLYVGEMARYYIYTVAEGSSKAKRWANIGVDENLPILYTTATKTNEYTLNWKQNFIPKNISHYEIAKKVDGKIINLATVAKDVTSYKMDDTFSSEQTYFLRTIPLNDFSEGNLLECLESSWNGYVGDQFANGIVNKMFDVENQGVAFYKNDSLHYYAFEEGKKIASQKMGLTSFAPGGGLTSSPKGHILRAFHDLEMELYYPLEDLRMRKINLQNFVTYPPVDVLLSDVGIGVINNNREEFSLVNFNTGEVLQKSTKTSFNNVNCISPDGKYLLVKNDSLRLLKYDGGTLSSVFKIPTEDIGSTIGFFGDNSGYFYYQNEWNVTVVDCTNLAQLGSYSINGDRIVDIDFENKRLLSFKMSLPYSYTIRDLFSGKQLKTIDNSTSVMHLFGNRLVSTAGVMYYLENVTE